MKKKGGVVKQRRRSDSVTPKGGNHIINFALIIAAVATGVFLLNPDSVLRGKKTVSSVLNPTRATDDAYIGSNISGKDWKNLKALQKQLEPRILGSMPSISKDGVEVYASDNRRRLELAQWLFAEVELNSALSVQQKVDDIQKLMRDLEQEIETLEAEQQTHQGGFTSQNVTKLQSLQEKLAQLRMELAYPHTLAEALKQPGAADMMEKIGNNLEWLEQILYTGEIDRPGEVLSILNHMRRLRPEILVGKTERNIATATALEFARSGWSHDAAVERAEFFIRNWKKGLLNTQFDKLPFWELRMVCGCKSDNDFGSVESLQWSLDHVHLPADQYPDCCWRCGYKLYNLYGESIHGDGYKAPFAPMYGRNAARFTYEVGGVCGSLSHFGAFAAIANGIPAMTVGEPGHCSFIVKVGDKWVPSYSLSWERDLHWSVWKDVYAYSSLHAAAEMYSAENVRNSHYSELARALALVLSSQDVSGAAAMFEVAVNMQPLNFLVWRDYVRFLQDKHPLDKIVWEKMHHLMCEKLVPTYPEIAATLCKLHVYPTLQTVFAEDSDKLKLFALDFWKSVDKMGPERWRTDELMDMHFAWLPETPDKLHQRKFYGEVLKSLSGNKEYAPIMLAKGAQMMKEMPAEQQKEFMASMVQHMKSAGGASVSGRNAMLTPLILSAELLRDAESFHAISALVEPDEKLNPTKPIPAFEPLPGKLVSADGFIYASSTCEWDMPCAHKSVLQPQGGFIHTASEENPWISVRLSKLVHLTGVVLVATPSPKHLERLNTMKVQVSESGRDDDWHEVAQIGEVTERVIRIDLTKEIKRANYVRVLRSGGPEFFHLNGIYVYGTPAS